MRIIVLSGVMCLKICYFTDLFYPYLLGGGENRYFEISRRLAKLGDEIIVVTTSLKGQPNYEKLNNKIRIFRYGFPKHPMTGRSLLPVPGYIFSSILNSYIVDDCDLLDLNTYASAFAGKFVSFLKGKPCVVTIHDVFTPNWLVKHNFYYGILGMLAENIISRTHKHGHFITVSNATKMKMVRMLKIDPRRIHVIPNGIDFKYIDRIASKAKKYFVDSLKRIVYVGRLVEYKNVDHLIHAVKQLLRKNLDVTLDVVGSGIERSRLERLALDLGVADRVTFHGFVRDKERVIELISRADVLVNPSSFEGFGIVLLEAMASRTPVIAYDLPAYHEFAINGYNAVLIRQKSVQKLVDYIYMVLTNEELSSILIQNGYKTARKYNWDNIVHKLRDVYNMILTQTRG